VALHAQTRNRTLLPPADLAGEIEKLRDELRNERDQHLRTLADFANYRRRIERDGKRLGEESKRALIIPVLDVIDDMEKALPWANDEKQPLVHGVRIIHHKLLALLATHDVFPFDSVGTPFNPDLHEAVAMAAHKGGEPGIVVDELRRGYFCNNEVLRPAQVRVSG
jgi:molecular chaperone GrpE